MKFVRFIENNYQELKLKSDSTNVFNPWIDSEIKATHQLLGGYRKFLVYFLMPKVFLDFVLVNMKLKKEPEPVILNMVKKQKEEREAAEKLVKESDNVSPLHAHETPQENLS